MMHSTRAGGTVYIHVLPTVICRKCREQDYTRAKAGKQCRKQGAVELASLKAEAVVADISGK